MGKGETKMKRYSQLISKIDEMSEPEVKELLRQVFVSMHNVPIIGEQEAFDQILQMYKERIII